MVEAEMGAGQLPEHQRPHSGPQPHPW